MKNLILALAFLACNFGAFAQNYKPLWVGLGTADVSHLTHIVDSCFDIYEAKSHKVLVHTDSVMGNYRLQDRSLWFTYRDSAYYFGLTTEEWVSGKYRGLKHMQFVVTGALQTGGVPAKVFEMTDGGFTAGKDGRTTLAAPMAYSSIRTGDGPNNWLEGTEVADPRALIDHYNNYVSMLKHVIRMM
jgi:hypothetical protein